MTDEEKFVLEALDEALKRDGRPPPAELNLSPSIAVVTTWDAVERAYESLEPPGTLTPEQCKTKWQSIGEELRERGDVEIRTVGENRYIWKNEADSADASTSDARL